MEHYIDYGRFAPYGAEREIVDLKYVFEEEGKKLEFGLERVSTDNHWKDNEGGQTK